MVRNVLGVKLRRDMLRSAMQFFSIIVLCALGTFAFSLLDCTARMVRTTLETYYEENNLADLWVNLPSVDRAAMAKIRSIPGVAQMRARVNVDMETPLGDSVTVNVMAFDGEMDINIPLLREGALLDVSDRRGCLIEERFAQAQGLALGDTVTVRLNGTEHHFLIRGIVVSPEYIVASNGISMDSEKYGYILVNAEGVAELPLNQIVVKVEPGTAVSQVEAAIQSAVPTALLMNRGSHNSTVRANNDAQMFENMTLIFPLMCYFIAALIVMTTLSRMIENQRLQIGTFKALGYKDSTIRRHYLSYAVVPSLLGGLLGLAAGRYPLPFVLWDVLIAENEMPYRLEPPVSVPAWCMVGLTTVMCVVICFIAYQREARENTASLLRPKPPKDGKRILLERMPFLWKRMNFNTKMVVRNLLRNKMRTFMSFVGILFCTMLIITSFDLQDSVSLMANRYYTDALVYDVKANLTGEVDRAESYERRLEAEKVECIMEQAISLRSEFDSRTTHLTVMNDDQTLQRLGPGETLVPIESGRLAITEKMAETLKVGIGDPVRFYLVGDDEAVEMTIGQIVCNNFSQGVYLNRTTWESLRKGRFTPTAILLEKPSEACAARLIDMDEVDSLDYPSKQINDILGMLESLSTVFTVLTGAALALAFVICYNMGLMNFVERTREYATLKVLGYHQKEIRRLILRESNIVTLLGMLCGIAPGLLLTDIILNSCEPETVNYMGIPTVTSVVWALVITFLFSYLMQRLLTRKVRTIHMVEALKSVE